MICLHSAKCPGSLEKREIITEGKMVPVEKCGTDHTVPSCKSRMIYTTLVQYLSIIGYIITWNRTAIAGTFQSCGRNCLRFLSTIRRCDIECNSSDVRLILGISFGTHAMPCPATGPHWLSTCPCYSGRVVGALLVSQPIVKIWAALCLEPQPTILGAGLI